MAQQNGFIKWMKTLESEKLKEVILDARKRSKTIFGIVNKQQDLEKEIMVQEAQRARELNIEREQVSKQKVANLSAGLFNCIPSNMDRYNQCFKDCRRHAKNMTEKKYLQTLLKLFKITLKSRNLPSALFTISANGKQHTLPVLKEKLRELLK